MCDYGLEVNLELHIVTALVLDAILGDPRWLPHPVRLIARLAEWSERIFRRLFVSERKAGICTVFSVMLGTGLAGWGVIFLAGIVHPWAVDAVSIYLLYTCFAARDLFVHSRNVVDALGEKDLNNARQLVGMIVGRDTEELEREGISRACVESVAENTVDGVTAPLFWAVIGGPIGALLYKAVNTMDSIFGYRNDRYKHFGWAPAKLDDLLNWIPARITGVVMVIASMILRMRPTDAWRVFRRDRLNHASPNSGHTEAAVAGALGIQLGGMSCYFGKPVHKPTIGDDCFSPDEGHVVQAQVLLVATTILMMIFLLCIRIFLYRIF